MTSHDLLAQWIHESDEVAFRELVKLHAPMVFSTSKRILGDAAEAEDVTQECFETLALAGRTTMQDIHITGSGRVAGHVLGLDTSRQSDVAIVQGRHTVEELEEPLKLGSTTPFSFVGGRAPDAEGVYSIEDLEPGEYTLLARSCPRGEWAKLETFAVGYVHVAAGETTTTDFDYK